MRNGVVAGAPVSRMSLVDVVAQACRADAPFPVEAVVADVAEAGVADDVVSSRPDVVFHLAAVVSGEAEADLEQGYRVNLDGTRRLLDGIRRAGSGYRPARRVRFVDRGVRGAVPGSDRRRLLHDAVDELRNAEGDRRVAAVGLQPARVPRRRGGAAADDLRASGLAEPGCVGFFSSIIREPLNGEEAVLPVSRGCASLVRIAAHGGRLPPARGVDRQRGARRPAVSDDARRVGDRGRTDRCTTERCRRRRSAAHPA